MPKLLFLVFRFLLLKVLASSQHGATAFSVVSGFPVPKVRLKNGKNKGHHQPRLCSVIGGTCHLLARVGFGKAQHTNIQLEAKSNRAVLQGKLESFSLHVQNSKRVEEFCLKGTDLDFVWMPFILTILLPAVLWFAPSPIIILWILYGWYLWTWFFGSNKRSSWRKQQQQQEQQSSTSTTTTLRSIMYTSLLLFSRFKQQKLRGKPSQLDYKITLNDDNLSNSHFIRWICQSLLRSLLLAHNSVLQVAAAAGDMIQDNTTKVVVDPQQRQQQQQKQGDLVVLKAGNQQAAEQRKLTKLLSATSFELRWGDGDGDGGGNDNGSDNEAPPLSPSFQDGRLVLPSRAVLPNEEGHLDFILRTKPQCSTTSHNNNKNENQLEFASPEVRFDVEMMVTETTTQQQQQRHCFNVVPAVILRNLLPKVVWLPIGSGIAIYLGKQPHHTLQRVGIVDGAFRVDGTIGLFQSSSSSKPEAGGALVFS